MRWSREPSREHFREEGGVAQPCIFEMEKRCFWNGAGNGEEQGRVVGRGADKGCECCVWVGSALCRVDKSTVKASHDRTGAFVAPSVQAIKQREFHNSEALDGVIEKAVEGRV